MAEFLCRRKGARLIIQGEMEQAPAFCLADGECLGGERRPPQRGQGSVTAAFPSLACGVLLQLSLLRPLHPALLPSPGVSLPSGPSPVSPRGGFGEGDLPVAFRLGFQLGAIPPPLPRWGHGALGSPLVPGPALQSPQPHTAQTGGSVGGHVCPQAMLSLGGREGGALRSPPPPVLSVCAGSPWPGWSCRGCRASSPLPGASLPVLGQACGSGLLSSPGCPGQPLQL